MRLRKDEFERAYLQFKVTESKSEQVVRLRLVDNHELGGNPLADQDHRVELQPTKRREKRGAGNLIQLWMFCKQMNVSIVLDSFYSTVGQHTLGDHHFQKGQRPEHFFES